MANDIKTTVLPKVTALSGSDDIIVNASGKTSRIPFESFTAKTSNWALIADKPFNTIDSNYFQVNADADNSVLSFTDALKKNLSEIHAIVSDIQDINKTITELQGNAHSHGNKDTIDKFGVNSDGKLTWDNIIVGSDYTLPVATISAIGGVKPDGTSITIDDDGTIHGASTYTLPMASTTVLGGVKVDGTTITIDSNGVIKGSEAKPYTLPVATTTTLGGIKPDGTTTRVNTNGVLTVINNSAISDWSATGNYEVGDLVIYENVIYQSKMEQSVVPTFNPEYWTALSGQQGEKGDKGEDGVSPTATVTQTELGATISVTDSSGTTTANISNGTSAMLSVSQTEAGCTVTATDASGTTTATVSNGTNGVNGDNGKSAYEIAVEKGYQGDEADWLLSLKAPVPSIDNSTKHWFIGTEDTNVVAEGKVDINADCAVLEVVLPASGWSDSAPYTQTVTVASISADNMPIVDLKYSDTEDNWESEEKAFACLTKIVTGDGSITAICRKEKPAVDFTIQMRVSGDVSSINFMLRDDQTKIGHVSLTTVGWNSETKTQTVETTVDTTRLNTPIPEVASLKMYAECSVYLSSETSSSLTFTCDEIPTENLEVMIKSEAVL